jgi:hypothetical protein
LRFQYVLSGWDGSAADAAVYDDARQTDLTVLAGKFYLADAGFGACDALLIPYHRIWYHLAEWGRTGVRCACFMSCNVCHIDDNANRPVNREELYNLRHASARNVIERIFGILKKCFMILTHPSEYDMAIQARIPPALCAAHNFIRIHDADGVHEFEPDLHDQNPRDFYGELAAGPAVCAEKERAEIRRDNIAQAMWESYQELVNDGMYDRAE